MGAGDSCHIAAHGAERALEFAAFRWPASGFPAAQWPLAAGGATRDASGRALLLHFAPGRWLAPGPAPELG
ncbi:MAG: hypothetical protein KGL25_13345, partial [Gammaproteobacteria bacterium]|nr:hypothetical protein [Gammaproteobacteria bacterium]